MTVKSKLIRVDIELAKRLELEAKRNSETVREASKRLARELNKKVEIRF